MPFPFALGGRPASRRRVWLLATVIAGLISSAPPRALAQGVDCARLQQQIASSGGGNRYAAAAQKQSAELARTSAYAHQLGCDRQQFLFFGGNSAPQCGGLNARISQMQANLSQLQAAGGGGRREDLVARFNAYCRGGPQSATYQPPRQRGFFESLFGGGEDPRAVPPADLSATPGADEADGGDGSDARGGSQAVCVRTCDGGFFPMNMSTHHSQDSLAELCSALCPNTQVAVYTRNPNSEIKTAVGLDGTPYMELPNALKFQKSFDAACTCRPADKTWAQALSGAESVLGNQRKGDILVTPEKSAELSRPKMDSKTRESLLNAPSNVAAAPAAKTAPIEPSEEVTGPDGVRRGIRTVGPKL